MVRTLRSLRRFSVSELNDVMGRPKQALSGGDTHLITFEGGRRSPRWPYPSLEDSLQCIFPFGKPGRMLYWRNIRSGPCGPQEVTAYRQIVLVCGRTEAYSPSLQSTQPLDKQDLVMCFTALLSLHFYRNEKKARSSAITPMRTPLSFTFFLYFFITPTSSIHWSPSQRLLHPLEHLPWPPSTR
jgi:hypothetical protein